MLIKNEKIQLYLGYGFAIFWILLGIPFMFFWFLGGLGFVALGTFIFYRLTTTGSPINEWGPDGHVELTRPGGIDRESEDEEEGDLSDLIE